LLSKGYQVHGIIRRSSSFNTGRLQHVYEDPHVGNGRHLFLHYGDLTDSSNLASILASTKPHEIYNLGAQSHVKVSFDMPEYTAEVDGVGTLRLLDAIRSVGLKDTKFYQASTSELYGGIYREPQGEETPFHPRSPYAIAKQFGYWITVNYREAYGLHASNGVLFNHESPRRGPTFVTRKITRAVARIKAGREKILWLGNLNAQRDWGHARDYVRAMWMMLQLEKGDDFVIGTGEAHSVREFCEKAFACIGVKLKWQGKDQEEVGINSETGAIVIRVDERYFRPTEVDFLLADPRKAKRVFGWEPEVSFEQLVKEMVEKDVELLASGKENE